MTDRSPCSVEARPYWHFWVRSRQHQVQTGEGHVMNIILKAERVAAP